ncbi:MAG: hypothetical protein ACLU6P_13880 [Roseburia intestinalis]
MDNFSDQRNNIGKDNGCRSRAMVEPPWGENLCIEIPKTGFGA